MNELELERTYLARYLPEGLEKVEFEEMVDIYVPESVSHPHLRIRQKGNRYEITKKSPILEDDASQQTEQTIPLDEIEYKSLAKTVGKKVHKTRFFFQIEGHNAEIDVFRDELEGLVLVDFEFSSVEQMKKFMMPDFCLVEVTQEDFIAGGMLCGKKYSEIEGKLRKHGYRKIVLTGI